MSLLSLNLGNGRKGTIELDTFTRMLNSQIRDNEEVRMDKPDSWLNGAEYMGVAPSGSSITDTVWACIKRTWFNNRCIRVQFKENMAWVDRDNSSW